MRRATLLAASLGVAGLVLWLALRDDRAGPAGPSVPARSAPEAPAAPRLAGPGEDGPGRAAEGAPQAGKAPEPEATFRGVVVDEAGKPVAGASVQAWSLLDRPPVVTAEDGSFAIVQAGRDYVLVRAWAKGLVPQDARATVYRGETKRVVLVPGCTARVEVRDAADGKPVAGALVRSICGDEVTTEQEWGRRARHVDQATTGADGVASVLATPGVCRFYVSARGRAATATEPAYLPPEGGRVEVLLGAGGTVEGRVVDPGGAGVAGARVHVASGLVLDGYATSAEDGSFRFEDVPVASSIFLSVRSSGFAPVAEEVGPPETGTVRSVTMRLHKGREVAGTVSFSDGRPTGGADIHAEPTGGTWFRTEGFGDAPHRAVADAEGRFRLEHVAVGELDVRAYLTARGLYADAKTVIPAEGPVPEVALVEERERGGVAVRARVVDAAGNPLAGACVDAERTEVEKGSDGFLTRACADASGRAVLTDLPAETMRLKVVGDGWPEHAVTVDLARPPPEEVEIRMPAGAVEGRLRFADGSPVRAKVVLECRLPWLPEGETSYWPHVLTDAEGRFRVAGLDDGVVCSLRLWTDGLALVRGPRTFRAGARPEWTVGRAGSPEGSGVFLELSDGATGAPIEDARVEIDLGEWVLLEAGERAGTYACEGPVEPGRYALRIRRPGFLEGRVADVAIGGTAGAVRVSVRSDPGAVIEGKVLAADGRPFGGVSVEVGEQEVETEEDGTFRVSGLPDGEVTVEVTGWYLQDTTRTVTVAREAPLRLEVRAEPAGAIEVRAPREPKPKHEIRLRLRGGPATDPLDLNASADHHNWDDGDEEEVSLLPFPSLAPGRYTLEVTWDGAARPPITADVRALETTEVRLTP